MLDLNASYEAIRGTAGVYRRGDAVLKVTGPQRLEYVQFLLAKSVEFVNIDTCVDSVLLDDRAHPVGLAVALIGADQIDLVVEAGQAWFDQAGDLRRSYDVAVDESGALAVQVEGPSSWKVAAELVTDRDISDVLLSECLDAELDGQTVRLARTGATAEYGYLVIAESPVALERLAQGATAIGGGLIDPAVLRRVRAEVNFPVLPDQLQGVSLFECGLPWLATITREDPFLGSAALEMAPPARRTVAAIFPAADCPAAGSPVLVDGSEVGLLTVWTPRANQSDGLGLLLLDDPFGVPGLTVEAAGVSGHTVSRPVIAPLSWSQGIGAGA
ncbi:MAG: hypothetical protein LBK54_04910 [Propionibacteriaceae bacterium]|jgi:aminomethyltransferase|nr:hypothetical protein [Propionibacteriaceae bacterium]